MTLTNSAALPREEESSRMELPAAGRRIAPWRSEHSFEGGAGLAETVCAFALLLSRYGAGDEVVLVVRARGGEVRLKVALGGNPAAAAVAAALGGTLREALGRGEAELADAPLLALAGGTHGPAAALALRLDGGEPASGAILCGAGVDGHAALGHFDTLRGALAADPGCGVLELPLLPPAEREARAAWNRTAGDLPHDVCLHAAFEARADADPGAPAAFFGDARVTYGELEARANRLAAHLRTLGVGPESRVGICVERGPRVLEAILGVLKAGGAYVPLDAAYPAARLAHMLETAGARILVTEAALRARLPEVPDTVLLDADADAVAGLAPARGPCGAHPENLAYVIFTSGSTGLPKGIALAHRGVMNNVADLNTRFGVGAADRVLLLSSLSFDMSVYEALGILAAGGAVVIPRPEELRDPAAWAALCRRHAVTLWNSAPALLGMLADHVDVVPADAPEGLRLAFLGGDWVPVPLVERVRAWAPGLRDFIVMGGATEASIHSIVYPVERVDPAWRSIPYGVPMANQRAYVLDPHLRELPAGVAGELYLAGIGLARGYAGRAGFTAERFLPDPHAETPGARMYRTGDLARHFPDGTIELLGRIDHQVKIRGFRIEPAEVEAALRRHPAVERAVVAARPGRGGENLLVAYLVPPAGREAPAASELRALLLGSLPEPMVPSAYVVLERLPLSANGKVDRAQLPEPPAAMERAPYLPPRPGAEAALAAVWEEVLGVERVGSGDDFFLLGGHSLLATRVVSRVRASLGAPLTVRDLFEAPTLAALAERVEAGAGAEEEGIPPLTPSERAGPLPLSFAQERLWFLDRLQPESAFYNIPIALRLAGPLDGEALERALGEVLRRHEALRTTFHPSATGPVQVVAACAGLALRREDLSALAPEAREAEAARRAGEDARRPFDLAAGPLLRATLLRLGEDEHVLLLCVHHVAGDGWSTVVLLRELSALYAASREGSPSPLPEPVLQYADYALWQRRRAEAGALEGEMAYWRARLAGAPELLDLPLDAPRPAVQSYRGAREGAELPAALVERLEALGRREGATLHMVLLGAWKALLFRYGAGEDLVVGTPVAGRNRPEVEALVGFFVNTLALRTSLAGDPEFREVVARVRAAALEAYENQELPFERLVEELRPERSLGHSPLVQAMFILQNNERAELALPGVRAEPLEVETRTTKFDLTLELTFRGSALRAELEYATDLLRPETARRMLAHLRRVLEQVAAAPDRRVGELELLDDAERHTVVEAWNRTAAPYPEDVPVHRLFEAEAARAPERVAVVCGEQAVTYAELDRRAGVLAARLASAGVGAETRVGLCLERGVEMVAAILGILKAGGAYLPLDPAYPPERLRLMLADAGVGALVTREALRGAVPVPPGVPVLSLDAPGADADPPATCPRGGDTGGRGLAYVMFTSGSTGRPRPVGVEHRAIVRLVRGARYARFGADEVVLQAAPVSFDAATFEIWGALLNGGRLVLLPGTGATLEELGRAVARHGVTTLWMTAGLFQAMAEERLEDLAPLGQLLAGGDVLPPETVARVRSRFPALRLVNGYGPTENTTFTCCYPVEEGWTGGPVPIGFPISNTRVYVLDGAMRPVPPGVRGELYAGGDGVARGYLGRPAATAERFVPDPFGTPGMRLYRTGDRVRWRADGAVEFLGRLDEQVKVRGFRVEVGEVEAALGRHPGVRECVVVVRTDGPGGARLVAYAAGEAAPAELRAHLRASLPEYMVPGAFVVLERLPLTANGKVDRRALPAPEGAQEEGDAPPGTPVEQLLAEIWGGVLGRTRVGARENFFELGGHSLLATRVVSRVREVFGVELTLRALFEAPTIAELAARVEAARGLVRGALPPLRPARREGPLPLSFAQERLWFLDRLQPGSAFYNVPFGLRLRGPLDPGALERALAAVVRRHEVLRATFPEVEGTPVQSAAPFAGLVLPRRDLPGADAAGREAELERVLAEEARRPFDLAAGPLFRPALLRLAADDHVLLLCMHHVLCDEWSMDVLFRELREGYRAEREGREPALPELPVQYADFAVWQREWLRGGELERQAAWWRAHLAGAPELLDLPTDRPRPSVQSHRGAAEPFVLPRELSDRLRALARQEGATLFMVLLGAFQALLSRYAGTEDVVVGSPIAGRTRGEVEGLIGFFVNTLALRGDLSGDPSFREVLRRVREATLGAYEHQEVPFEQLVAELRPRRSLSHTPLFQAMFVQETAAAVEEGWPEVEARRLDAESGTAKFDLTLVFGAGEEEISGTLEYATDLFDAATAARMLTSLRRLLEGAAADPAVPLAHLELLEEADRRRVLEAWGSRATVVPAPPCVHRQVEARAAASPGAVAILHAGGSLTYGELDALADRLARRLADAGAGPEARVALCLGRGPELVVAMLAVLKAGGAYVPLDPEYPAERLSRMLADSGAAVLLAGPGGAPAELAVPPGTRVLDAVTDPAGPALAPAREADPRTLAYVVYTSGSTGTPKGVGIEHRSLAHYVAHAAREYGLGPGDRVLQFHSASFDPAAEEVFATLSSGATLVLRDDEWLAGPASFWAACRHWEVTVLDLPTAVWHPLPAHLEAHPHDLPPSLRLVVTGGERLLPEPLAAWTRIAGARVRLLNSYGPTETTVGATLWDAAAADAATLAAVPIGRPVPGCRTYVLDAGMRPVPPGVAGELYVGGVQVARGYLRRPDATAAAFVPDPFTGEPGARLYRTGDRVRWRAGGELEFLGRADGQAKVRGFRVEPGEAEAALLALPGIREAAVGTWIDPARETRLVAWLVADGPAPAAAALREALGRTLPDYLVPSAFVALDALPLTRNGKVDRDALPAPAWEAGGEGYVAPRTPAEALVAEVWAEVLGMPWVGVRDDFFALGGHSLLATRVVSRVLRGTGVELPVRALFEAPTVEALAARVDAARGGADAVAATPPVVPVERGRPLRLSFAQERLWLVERIRPGTGTYNVPAVLELAGPLDADVLERALSEVVRRHETLRATFEEDDGTPVQVVHPAAPVALARVDLSALPLAEGAAEAERLAGEEARRPFDLDAGPLLRAVLLRLAPERHRLLLTLHHVVTDAWSHAVLLRELGALYPAFLRGERSPLPPLPVQYADFAVWQREHLSGERLEPALAWWCERLAGAPSRLELPADRPRPAVPTQAGAVHAFSLAPERAEAVRALARGEGATPYMVLLAVFHLLLGRYAGREDVVVGSPVAGRTRPEVEGLIGFFVNTLVMRGDLSGGPTFAELVARTREAALGAYAHQEVPFERLIEALAPERTLQHNPLFQVMFAVQNAPPAPARLGGVEVRALPADAGAAHFDLTLAVEDAGEGMEAVLEYATDLFDAATAERMAAHFVTLLEAATADPSRRASALPLLDGAERARLLEEWSGSGDVLPPFRTVHEAVAARAAAHPDAVAVACGACRLSYAELNARANRLARHLRRRGVGVETRVGVLLERSVELPVALLAVLKAGAAYVPLDPSFPSERLDYVLADAAAELLVTRDGLRSRAGAGLAAVSVDGDAAGIAAESATDPGPTAGPEHLAYVIYTSGSTGTPKGSMVPHRAVPGYAGPYLDLPAGTGPETWLQYSSLSWDALTLELWTPLLRGARCVLFAADGEEGIAIDALGREIAAQGVTTLWMTASLFNAVLESAPEALAPLRVLMTGGEALSEPHVRRALERFPALRLVNGYGPSECTVFSACRVLGAELAPGPVPIGRPVGDRRVHVLDGALEPSPTGVPGELYVGGPAVARGYLGRPALTAEKFVPDPFDGGPGARLYRTGDRVRWLAGGELEFVGRADQQVKVRGYRIEPGEVEAALLALPGVREAAVAVRADAGGEKRLVAWIVAEGDAPSTAEVRAALGRSLPEYMVPSAVVALDALPLTRNAKVDREALPAPAWDGGGEAYVAPRTPAEALVAEVWAEVLGVERVGVRDNFFALGGHSLRATRVVARIRRRAGVELPVRLLFESPTVEGVARALEARASAPTESAGLAAAAAARAGGRPLPDGEGIAFPLSSMQKRLWFLDRMEPGSPLYNVPAAWRLRGRLDVAGLGAALDEVARRQESLRTVFRVIDGAPAQVVRRAAPVALPVEDLSALPPAEAAARARRRAAEHAEAPFDLERGPLFRAVLLRLSGEEHHLLLCMHHIVSDGWSLGVLCRELEALYGAHAAGAPAGLAELSVQYGDYAAWQGERLSDERMERVVAWWRAHLAGAPTLLELPTDRPRPAVQRYRGALHRFRVDSAAARAVEALAREEGATPYMVLLSAYHLLLARYSRQDDVVVGSPIANRELVETEAVIGFFANTIAVRADLSGDTSFRTLVRRVRDAALGAYAHQDVPFERLVDELQPGRSLGHNPIFQAFFTLAEGGMDALSLAGVEVDPVPIDGATAKFDLSLFLRPEGAGLEGTFEYATDLFDADTAARAGAHYAGLVAAAAAAPDLPLSRLPLLAGGERERVLEEWSGGTASHPATGTLHGRFEAAARATPEAPALTLGAETLTYAALDARAARLAAGLRARGVGPDTRVGLCAERSIELVVGILAILKAGGAYVPLDPAYPAERLAYMAADSEIRVALAQGHLAGRLPDGVEVLALEAEPGGWADGAEPGLMVDPQNLAYVIYTSGSTGRPKGVGVTHANVLRLFDATEGWFRFAPTDVWTLFHSYAFDFSVWETWGALLHGARLVVVPWEVSRDPVAFRALLARERVTSLSQTPSAFRALAQVDEAAVEPLGALRLVVFGGEALNFESLRGWLDRYGPARPRLVNMYGITETTVHVTHHAVTGAELRRPGVGTAVGVPIPDLRCYVLDAHGQPLPPGVPGELCVGGAGPARGYLRRPALTAERFVPDPYSGVPGARLYRSGDLGRWTPAGTLESLGRMDQQVKVRGFRIEPGEVEAALLALPGVAAAAVVVRGTGDDAALAAYVVPTAGRVDPAALRDGLRRHLPEHMVPSAFVALDRLPLTINGKLDRKALPEPEAGGTPEAGGAGAFRTPAEELLAGIWAEVLRTEHVGAEDDFFLLGGHSLRATQVTARVQEVFGVAVPLRAIFETPTLRALAARIDAARRDGGAPAEDPVVPVDRAGPLPLSFAQQRLWFLDRMRPGAPWYNVAVGARIRGALDVSALERALGELVRRHETLRTVFALHGDEPVQRILPWAPVALARAAVDALPPEREEAVRRWTDGEAARPFDLAEGPVFRPALLCVDAEDHVLVLAMHHVATDGWSTGVLFRELAALYGAFRAGEPSPLPEPAVQYADYAAWQRSRLGGRALDAQVDWWRRALSGAPTRLELPGDRPRPAVQGHRGGAAAFQVGAETGAALRALARREGSTLFMVLLAAFQAYLARASGQPDLLVGTPVAGRGRRELEPLVGFFVNTVPLRGDCSDDPAFSTLLSRVRDASLGAYAHQDLPFERLVDELGVERDLSRSPLVQVMFALREADDAVLALPELDVEEVEAGTGSVRQDLMLTLVDRGAALDGVLEYAAELYDPETAGRMARQFCLLLDAAAAGPELRVSALPLMDAAERRQVLEGWNATGSAYPDAERSLSWLLERQAARTPDAPALVFEGRTLTYLEVHARAARLARHLRRQGVGPETRVGVCAERSHELVVALLAVGKAGGAYVPLDPGYPEERLAYVLADSGVGVVLAQERFAERLPHGTAVVRLEAALPAEEPAPAPLHAQVEDPDRLAYVIYTSGSTGRPKGAMNAHRGIVNRLLWMQEAYRLEADDVVLQKTPFGFDVSVWEFFWPLMTGARLVLARPEGHRDPGYLAELIEREGVTTCHFVPSMLSAFLDGAGAGRCPRLRRVVCSGEALAAPLVRRFRAAFPHVELHNLYGPTEAAVDVTAWACGPRDEEGTVPIGRPIANTRTYVLDPGGEPLPAGAPGELYLGGVQVGRGYLARPALTAERFVPDPFSPVPGCRMYRTGDLARWRGDGVLEYLGRTDFQVKLRGLRIELGEIETALRAQAGVREAVVVLRGEEENASLAAYLVPEPGESLDEGVLCGALRRTLPEYMVPGVFVTLERLPLSANGKLDRGALPAPVPVLRGGPLAAAGTALERSLAAVWREVLGVEEVGVEDSFFSLGGHSLLLTRVHRRLAEDFPALTLLELFEHPTIRTLAAHLADGTTAAGQAEGEERAALRNDLRARRQRQLLRRTAGADD